MRNQDVTLEGLVKKVDSKIDALASVVERITGTLDKMDQRFDSLEQKVDENTSLIELLKKKVDDNTSSIEFLVEHAITREEASLMMDRKLDEKLIPMESRLLATMDVIVGKHQTFEIDVLAHTYKIDRLEQAVGVSGAM